MGFPATAVICALLFFWLPPQILSSADICGTVQDQTGASVAANLELSTANTRLHAKTDAGGQFFFHRLTPWELALDVQTTRFQTNKTKTVVSFGLCLSMSSSLNPHT